MRRGPNFSQRSPIGTRLRLADLSGVVLSRAKALGTVFERASLLRARLIDLAAHQAVFEFADLGQTKLERVDFF
jgi:uncharacterized protein YjbI with pentapeptide repeats